MTCSLPGRGDPRPDWYFFVTVIGIIANVIDRAAGLTFGHATYAGGGIAGSAGLLPFLPTFAVLVRRLHETVRSGWWRQAVLRTNRGGGISWASCSPEVVDRVAEAAVVQLGDRRREVLAQRRHRACGGVLPSLLG